jgi:hypothetical protein
MAVVCAATAVELVERDTLAFGQRGVGLFIVGYRLGIEGLRKSKDGVEGHCLPFVYIYVFVCDGIKQYL